MSGTPSQNAALQLAEKVILDIRARGLKPGDRYLTSDEAREAFRVRKSLINSAMAILAQREILVRQRKAGTFVGPQFKPDPLTGVHTLQSVFVMMSHDYYRARVVPADVFVDALADVLPDAAVQMHFIPDHRALEHTRQIVDDIERSDGDKNAHGLILIRSPREAQRLVEDSGIPAVIFGSAYPDVKHLPCLDIDQALAGRLGARHALERGHRRFLMVNRNEWRRGDNLALQGVTAELAEAQLGLDALQVASIPAHAEVIGAEIRACMKADDHPTALLCRGSFIADPVLDVVTELGYAIGDGGDIDVLDLQRGESSGARCPSICPVLNNNEQVHELGRILALLSDAEPLPQRETIIPVELIEPDIESEDNGHSRA